ncbi:MAG: hypothetical protein HC901_03830, partial [Bdellovibrionaceae bacterium]|nr:hypothetical protein [Pseudobdellovibrionaceae bacterium]
MLPVMAVQRLVLDNEARRCGLDADLDQITRFLTQHPFFQKQGAYHPAAFREFETSVLLPQGIDTERLGALVGQHLRVQELLELTSAGLVIEPAAVDREFARRYGSCRMAAIPFSLSTPASLPEPAEEALAAYHQTHAQRYQTTETRSVRCAVFRLTQEQAGLPDQERQEALSALQQKSFEFATPFFETQQGDSPAPDFTQNASSAGAEVLTASALTPATAGLANLPGSARLVQAAFTLVEPGQVSEAVTFDGGVAVLQLIESVPSVPRTFAEARPEVLADYQAQELRLQFARPRLPSEGIPARRPGRGHPLPKPPKTWACRWT